MISIKILLNFMYYFFLYTIEIGTPSKSKYPRILCSKNRVYDSPTYCGKLQKNANVGDFVGNWVIYLIFTYFCLVAGGGFASGLAYGETDELGQQPTANECTPADLCTTVLHLLGISANESILTDSGRPMKIIERGRVITGALS